MKQTRLKKEKILLYNKIQSTYRRYIVEDEITTIQLKKSVVQALKAVKRYLRETYSETILRLITEVKENEDFGIFVQKAQQSRMKELWEDGDYSGWENA